MRDANSIAEKLHGAFAVASFFLPTVVLRGNSSRNWPHDTKRTTGG